MFTHFIMADREELEKLFVAALHDSEPPPRFGTPADQMKAAPAVFQKAEPVFQKAEEPAFSAAHPFQAAPSANPFVAAPSEAKAFVPFTASPFQAAPSEDSKDSEVLLDEKAVASLDGGLNAELEAILDKKIAKERAKRRRDRLMVMVLLIGMVGGSAGWLVANPDKMEAIQKVISEIGKASDPNAVANEYKKSLEKVAVRGDQLGDATSMIGGKAGEGEDPGMSKEMKQVAGDDAGLSPDERQKQLKEKFDSMPKK